MFQKNEGFSDVGYTQLVNPTRSDYIEVSKKRYNPMADTADVIGPGLFGISTSPDARIQLNQDIGNALKTTGYQPTLTNQNTYMQPDIINAKVAVPPPSSIIERIKNIHFQIGVKEPIQVFAN
jgi:hypothetical protein